MKSYAALPENAKKYIQGIADLSSAPVTLGFSRSGAFADVVKL